MQDGCKGKSIGEAPLSKNHLIDGVCLTQSLSLSDFLIPSPVLDERLSACSSVVFPLTPSI